MEFEPWEQVSPFDRCFRNPRGNDVIGFKTHALISLSTLEEQNGAGCKDSFNVIKSIVLCCFERNMGNSTSNQNSESEQEDVEVCMNGNDPFLEWKLSFSCLTFLGAEVSSPWQVEVSCKEACQHPPQLALSPS